MKMAKTAEGTWAYTAAQSRIDSRQLIGLFKKIGAGEKIHEVAKEHSLTYAQMYYAYKRWVAKDCPEWVERPVKVVGKKGKEKTVKTQKIVIRMFTREFCICASELLEDQMSRLLGNPHESTFPAAMAEMCTLFPSLGKLREKAPVLDVFQSLRVCIELSSVHGYTAKVAWLGDTGNRGSYMPAVISPEDISVLD